MSGSAFVGFRVTPEVKTLLQGVADRQQVSVSSVARQLVETMLRSQVLSTTVRIEPTGLHSRDARLSIRLDPEDRMMLTSRAAARGMRSATYVSVLVRAHLRNITPLPAGELAALKRSIAELGALGKQPESDGEDASPGRSRRSGPRGTRRDA